MESFFPLVLCVSNMFLGVLLQHLAVARLHNPFCILEHYISISYLSSSSGLSQNFCMTVILFLSSFLF